MVGSRTGAVVIGNREQLLLRVPIAYGKPASAFHELQRALPWLWPTLEIVSLMHGPGDYPFSEKK